MHRSFVTAVAIVWIVQSALTIEQMRAQPANTDFGSLASHGLTHVIPIPLPSFVNTIERFTSDGEVAHVVKAWDEGHQTYLFTIKPF